MFLKLKLTLPQSPFELDERYKERIIIKKGKAAVDGNRGLKYIHDTHENKMHSYIDWEPEREGERETEVATKKNDSCS